MRTSGGGGQPLHGRGDGVGLRDTFPALLRGGCVREAAPNSSAELDKHG